MANGSEEVDTSQNQQQNRGRPVGYRERGRSVGSVGPMRSEKRSADKSPYSSGPYLSPPPPDTSWRRTHSDSALHHSVSQSSSVESIAHLHSPGSQRRSMQYFPYCIHYLLFIIQVNLLTWLSHFNMI